MWKTISITVLICLLVAAGGAKRLHAGAEAGEEALPKGMKDHIDKVKISNPQKYQEMVQRAGQTIRECRDCHKEIPQRGR